MVAPAGGVPGTSTRSGTPLMAASVPTGLLIPVLAGVYWGAARLGLALAFVAPQVTVVWPPTGIALAAILLLGARAAPGVWLGAFLANVTADAPLVAAAGIATGNMLEAVVGAWLLQQVGFRPSLERLRDVLCLIGFGALTSTTLSATIGTASLCLAGMQPCAASARIWFIWWLGDAMGALVVAPLLLTWAFVARGRPPARELLRLLVFLAGVAVLCWLVFAGPVARYFPQYPYHYALVPLMIGAALRFGQLGTTAVTAIASAIAIAGTAVDPGRLGAGDVGHTLVLLQLFLAVVASSGLILAAAINERAEETRRREADYVVTQALAESGGLDVAAPRILRAMCESLRWDLGALWVPGEDGLLRCLELWRVPSRPFSEFESVSRGRTFAPGVGLPGRVWASGEPVWIPDVVVDSNFPRSPMASREGLHSAFAFPIRVRERVLGVMEFFSLELQGPDDALLARMTALGSQMGQFIERRRAEDERALLLVREQEARIQAQALARVGRDLAQSLQPDVVGQRIVERVCDLLRARVAVLYAVDAESGDLLAVARAGKAAPRLGQDYGLTHGAGLVGLAIREGRQVASDDVLGDSRIWYSPDERARIERAGHRAACALPLIAKGNVIGALGIGGEAGRIFDERAIGLAEVFGDLAALALDNARNFASEQLARAEAEAANRAKDEFLAMLSHELRNPLGAIASATSVLNLTQPDDQSAQLREIIVRQVAHLTRLVDDLLDVARLTSGRLELQRRVVDLGKLVDHCVTVLSARASGHRLEIETTSVLVDGDPARLEQVVANLLDNAVKYTPPEGTISVMVARAGDQAVLRVRDSGVGIAPGLLPRVFDLFTQGARSLDRARGGLGLGLAVVKRLVTLHGGRVSAESAGQDQGSEFTVELPIAEVAASRAAPRPEATPALRPHRVLIVEDHEDARESLRLLLAAEGHTVETASDGLEGLEALRAWRPDIALVDVGLPGLDGYAFARAVRGDPEIGQTPLVAITGYGQPEDRRQSSEAGFNAHLVKPVRPEALLRAMALLAEGEAGRLGDTP